MCQAQNHIVGESISPAPSAAEEKKTEESVEGSAPAAGDDAEDGVEAEDDDEDEIDLMDVFFDESQSSKEAKPQAKGARAQVKANGKQVVVDKTMPPPLSKTVIKGSAVKRKKGDSAPMEGKQLKSLIEYSLTKATGMCDSFEQAQRATVLGYDKKFFKDVKVLIEKVEHRLVTAPQDLREKMSYRSKYLDIIVRLIKAYKVIA